MRMAFGLVGLLVTVGIILMLMNTVTVPTLREGQRVREDAEQLSGRGPGGVPVGETIRFEPRYAGNQLEALVVADIEPGGPMAQHFGLRRGDEIIEIGPQRVRDMMGDFELAEAQAVDAYRLRQELVVLRGGEELTLPRSESPAAPERRSPLQDQLDAIQRIPTH